MGEKNNALTVYMNRPDRIRSVLEYYLGDKLPPDWECREIRGFYTIRNTNGKLSARQRDFLGIAQAWGNRFLLGLEHQENIGLTFPWRLMEMDCLSYGNEIQKNQQKNSANEVHYSTEDDFQYRYRKSDQVPPVLTLTLYWGKKPWKEPLSLTHMMAHMGTLPKKMQLLAGDYRVHLVQMRLIADEDLRKMDSDLKYVLGIMKCIPEKDMKTTFTGTKNSSARFPKAHWMSLKPSQALKTLQAASHTYLTRTPERRKQICAKL